MNVLTKRENNEAATYTCFVIVGLVSLVFWRGVPEAFDLVKATILWTSSPLLVGLALLQVGKSRKELPASVLITATAFVVGLITATFVSSEFTWTSIWGQNQRYTGLLTFVTLVALMLSASFARVGGSTALMYFSVLLLVSSGYVFLQYSGNDPFEWTTVGFGNPVFGTIGNPNTAAGFCVLLAPFSLALGLSKSRKKPQRYFGVLVCLCSLISIEILDSFQANIAALALLFFSVYWLRRIPKFTLLSVGGIFSLTLAIVLFPNLDGFVLQKFGFAALVAPVIISASSSLSDLPVVRRRFSAAGFISLVSVIAASSLVFRPSRNLILQGFQEGFSERGDFLRAGWSIFVRNPLFGSGLETFGFYFTEFRPVSHAERLEESRTSSAHNIFLGMFSNGGLVLGLAYLALVVSLIWLVIKALSSRRAFTLEQIAIAVSFLIFQVISMVTVEHIALFSVGFLINGLLVSQFAMRDDALVSVRRRRISNRSQVSYLLVGFGAACSILASGFTTWRPYRAAQASVNGRIATSIEVRYEENKRATDLAPWEGQYWVYRAEVELALELFDDGVNSIQQALESLNYSATFAPDASRVLAQLGRFDLALAAISKGIKVDPFAPKSTAQLLELLDAIEEAAATAGDQDVLEEVANVRASLPENVSN